MKLRSKTFLYSLGLSCLIVLVVISYLIFMLPSLYVYHQKQHEIDESIALHQAYVNDKKMNQVESQNSSFFHLVINPHDYQVKLSVLTMEVNYQIETVALQRLLDQLNLEKTGSKGRMISELDEPFWNEFGNLFFEEIKSKVGSVLEIKDSHTEIPSSNIKNLQREFLLINENTILLMKGVEIQQTDYFSHLLMTYQDGQLMMTGRYVINPHVTDLLPTIMAEIPMIGLLILLISLLGALYFSYRLIHPVVALSRYISKTKQLQEKEKIEIHTNDEIGELAQELNRLYERLTKQNKALMSQQKQRELFLQASAHQLKTPLASSLLLIQGMIDNLGPYQQHQLYLPEVKQQLQLMAKRIQETLDIHQHINESEIQSISLKSIVEKLALESQNLILKKELSLNIQGDCVMNGYRPILELMVDNLLINAILYTQAKGMIEVVLTDMNLTITNTPIDHTALSHTTNASVGLNVVSQYAQFLNIEVLVEKSETQFKVGLNFTKNSY